MQFFHDISINKKILLAPAITFMALGIIMILTLISLNRQQFIIEKIHGVVFERITRVNEFIAVNERVQSDISRIAVLHFMNLPKKKIESIHRDLEQGISDLNYIYNQIQIHWELDAEETNLLDQIKISMDVFQNEAKQAADVAVENPSFGIILIRSALIPFRNLRKHLNAFLSYQHNKIKDLETTEKQITNKIKWVSIIVVFSTILIAIWVTILIGSRFISQPISKMTMLMQQLSQGDLSVKIAEQDRQDEIGSMASAMEIFRENAIQRKKAEKIIRENEQRLRLLINATPDIICFKDEQGRWLETNDSNLEVFSLTQVDYKGKTDSQLAEFTAPIYRKAFLISKATDEKAWQEKDISRGEETIPGSDGSKKIYDVIKVPIFKSDGARKGLIVLGRDITERKQTEYEKEKLITELNEALTTVKTLKGLLPICSYCKKIRDDRGYWNRIEDFLTDHSEVEFSHSLCQNCVDKYHPDLDLNED